MYPVIVGGNGHSGTRLFAEILMACGVSMGIGGISHARKSKDLNIRGLMNRWMKPYLLGLSEKDALKMRRQFARRINLLLPFRSGPWGFKNPRTMFLLPMYAELFPEFSYVHVIRDGRDMCFGNPFINSPTYWSFVSEEESQTLPLEERMIKFWGASNRKVQEFGQDVLGDRYLEIRFEDMCDYPDREILRMLSFIGQSDRSTADLIPLVKKPKSIGRWKTFDTEKVENVLRIGDEDLRHFGYE